MSMRLSCQQEDLNRGLAAVSRAIPARSTLPITQHVLLEAADGAIVLSATDAETIAITYRITATIGEPGAITMPSRLLADFVSTLPHDEITMTLAERSRQVSLACARNTASVGGMDPDDFPPIPVVSGGDAILIPASRLRAGIAQTVFSAATDDSRPVLTGVHFGFAGGALRLAAADGFRLSVHTMEIDSKIERQAIVPARALNELGRLLGEAADTAEQDRALLVHHRGQVAALVEDHVERLPVREEERLLDAPISLLVCHPLPGVDGDAGLGVRRRGMVLGREDVAAAPGHLGPKLLERLDEHSRLDGHVQAAGDPGSGQRL